MYKTEFSLAQGQGYGALSENWIHQPSMLYNLLLNI